MDLRMSPTEQWLAGGFSINDHEINQTENTGPIEIEVNNYLDMTPFGNWIQKIPSFNSSATDDEKTGISKSLLAIYFVLKRYFSSQFA